MRAVLLAIAIAVAAYFISKAVVRSVEVNAELAKKKMDEQIALQEKAMSDQKAKEGTWWYQATAIIGAIL